MSLNAAFTLPKDGDPITTSSSLFGDNPKVSSVQTVDKFSFEKQSTKLVSQFVIVLTSSQTISTLPHSRCNFTDLRQWVPTFEVRVGDEGGFTWKKGETA